MNELKWTIYPEEQKRRSRKLAVGLIPISILFLAFVILDQLSPADSAGFLLALFIAISVPFLLLFLSFVKTHKKRSYFLSDKKLTISKNNKIKEYFWDEFEYFFSTKKFTQSPYYSTRRKIKGDIYYLKKKPKNFLGRLCKKIVVIYSNPEINDDIDNFLLKYLPLSTSLKDEMGLTVYEFK